MQKIRYRLVYNRKKVLNAQGCALVQVEAKLNQRNIYLTTNIYIQPDNWDKSNSQVINHPQATELNAMLALDIRTSELSIPLIWFRLIVLLG